MSYGPELISKICDSGDITAIKRYQIEESDFPTPAERKAFRFIIDYAEANGGKAPSGAAVEAEVPEFAGHYIPNVAESFEWLVEKFKDSAAKRKFQALFGDGGEASRKFDELPFEDFAEWLTDQTKRITMGTNVRSVGHDIKSSADEFLAEYERRKAGDSYKVYKSAFPKINETVGGYYSSNVYVVYGKSGRGKSVITLEEAVEAAMQGATVLVWSMEMGWFEVMVRIFVSVSARLGLTVAEIDGVDMAAGFDASELRNGRLNEKFEQAFREFLRQMNDLLPGTIIVRAVDDEDFMRRDLRALEADILATGADVVVLDPFYYLDYERNTSKTSGGDAAETSKKLRRLAGRTKTVIFAITQADETKESKDEDGNRELKLPAREDVKKTKQLLEDAYLLIAVDTDYLQRRGRIGLNKGRDGGEGTEFEITYIPQYGIVREVPTGDAAAPYFGF
ncbi:MAG: AAA family ATPase [Acidobacterium ailaaui]|nr:AAA family ATPase [Pseudacidobacterium ailaaui]